MLPLTMLMDHHILVFRSCELTGPSPRTKVCLDDPIQDRGHDKSPPLRIDSFSNLVVLTSCLKTKGADLFSNIEKCFADER
ncbi:hypothetical protein Bca101_101051 [Brassica carinata]